MPHAGEEPLIDPSKPNAARRYDYLLGGTTNYAVDRESAEAALKVAPSIRTWARENRWFMRRAVAHLAAEAGIRQFLDLGSGIPTAPNLHEVVQGTAPDSRVVYVDDDPGVIASAQALLAGAPAGRTSYVEADLTRPGELLGRPELTDVLDLTRPVALSLIAVLHFFKDAQDPYGIVSGLMEALPSGSYLVIAHSSWDYYSAETRRRLEPAVTAEGQPRSRAEFARFFAGLELVEPGIALISEWRRPPAEQPPPRDEVSAYGAVARKP